MIDTNVKLELEDIRNIEASYRWMHKFINLANVQDPSGKEEFLEGTQKTLQKINLIESWIHFESRVDKIFFSFPKDGDIKSRRLEKWQYYANITKNREYWKKEHGKEISKLQSGWELGYFKLKENRSG